MGGSLRLSVQGNRKVLGTVGTWLRAVHASPRDRQMNRHQIASVTLHSPAIPATYKTTSAAAVFDKISTNSSSQLREGFVIFFHSDTMMPLGQPCNQKPVEVIPSRHRNSNGKENLSQGAKSCSLHTLLSHLHLPIPTAAMVVQQCQSGKGPQTFIPALG